MKTVVVLPTYNERGTVGELIERIFSLESDIEVIAVDDNSPDGTGAALDRLREKYPRLEVIHRSGERGRGTAGIAGFKRALLKNADYIIEMDADFSHDPRYIPFFLSEIEEADIVIGSRYAEGGQDAERHFIRNIISMLANAYIRFMMGIPHVKDCTSGFRCFRRDILADIGFDSLTSKGPSVVTEILYRCKRRKIKEVPIIFKKRLTGKSKFNFRAMADSLLLGLKLRATEIFRKNIL